MANPYQPIAPAETEAFGAVEDRSSIPAFWLCVAPWKFPSVARRCGVREGLILGWLGLAIQFGAVLYCWAASVGEPYGTVGQMLTLPLRGYIFLLVMGGIPATFLISMAYGCFGAAWGRLISLTPWMLLFPFFAWIFCHFNMLLDDPGLTIINDHRPDWMKHDAIISCGLLQIWIGIFFLTTLAIAFYSHRFVDSPPFGGHNRSSNVKAAYEN